MIIVRHIFVAKPRQRQQARGPVQGAVTKAANLTRHRVLTDLTGDLNRVVLEYEVDNMAGVEAEMKNYATNEAMRALMGSTRSMSS
jgi:hypothetical protein